MGSVKESTGARTSRDIGWKVMWIAVGFLAFCAYIMASAFLFGGAGYVSPIGGLLVLVSLAVLFRGLRRDWDMAVMNYLDQAVRLNLPLPAMLRAAELSERRPVRRRLRKLRERIEEGEMIAPSLRRATPGLSVRMIGIVAAAERSGRLANALSRLVRKDSPRKPVNVIGQIYLRWYPLVLFIFTGGAMFFIATFIFPKFQSIMGSFGLPMPRSMRIIIYAADYLAPLSVVGLVVGAIALMLFFGRMFATILSAKSPDASALNWPAHWTMWHLPVARKLTRARALADTCHLIADALEAGRPLDWALYETSEVPTNLVLQRKLLRWARGVTAGHSAADAARAARMPEFVCGMIASAQAAADLPQVMDFLGRYYDGRFSRAAQVLRGAAIPALAICFGLVVLLITYSLFEPMIQLIDHLAPSKTVL
jgi:type II secretory pathway component PulF